MNGEYAGFFDIGMVQRNEVNAIIVHGTMCLIRRAALDSAGGWSSDTICEDTDLGLTILERGWLAHYTNRRYGHGLLPDTFEAYKKQRHRWAYGGFQIVRKHWRRLLPGADASHARAEARIRARLAQLARRRKHRRRGRDPQPRLGAGRRVRRHRGPRQDPHAADPRGLRGLARAFRRALPAARARIRRGQMLGAVFAAMSVQWTVARAVGFGVIKERLPFVRTAKGGVARKGADFPAFWEARHRRRCCCSARLTLVVTNYKQVREINIFAVVLVVQSLPFLAAVALAADRRHALQRASPSGAALEADGLRELVAARQAVAERRPPKLSAENRIEAAQ